LVLQPVSSYWDPIRFSHLEAKHAVYPLWWPSLTKDMQTEQHLCWSGMTDTEHSTTSGSSEKEEWLEKTVKVLVFYFYCICTSIPLRDLSSSTLLWCWLPTFTCIWTCY